MLRWGRSLILLFTFFSATLAFAMDREAARALLEHRHLRNTETLIAFIKNSLRSGVGHESIVRHMIGLRDDTQIDTRAVYEAVGIGVSGNRLSINDPVLRNIYLKKLLTLDVEALGTLGVEPSSENLFKVNVEKIREVSLHWPNARLDFKFQLSEGHSPDLEHALAFQIRFGDLLRGHQTVVYTREDGHNQITDRDLRDALYRMIYQFTAQIQGAELLGTLNAFATLEWLRSTRDGAFGIDSFLNARARFDETDMRWVPKPGETQEDLAKKLRAGFPRYFVEECKKALQKKD